MTAFSCRLTSSATEDLDSCTTLLGTGTPVWNLPGSEIDDDSSMTVHNLRIHPPRNVAEKRRQCDGKKSDADADQGLEKSIPYRKPAPFSCIREGPAVLVSDPMALSENLERPSTGRFGRIGAAVQNHCPGSIKPRSISCCECQRNAVELRHWNVGISQREPGLVLSAFAVRNEHTDAVRLLCQGQA